MTELTYEQMPDIASWPLSLERLDDLSGRIARASRWHAQSREMLELMEVDPTRFSVHAMQSAAADAERSERHVQWLIQIRRIYRERLATALLRNQPEPQP